MKKSSKENSVLVDVNNHIELDTFKRTYPLLFGYLESTFGLMPSNSGIDEQTHEGMCEYIKASDSLAFINVKNRM